MEQHSFTPNQFFDLSAFPYQDIFAEVTDVWDVLPKIIPYIEAAFQTGKLTANYKDRKDVFIGEGTVVHPHVEIIGPAIIGKNCILGHASLVRGGVILGDNVHIGHAVEVKHSLFLNNAAAAHLNYIGDSVIGNSVNISGGAILANYRLDKKPVSFWHTDKKIETNLDKFGAVLGDNTIIGVSAVLNPGTILGKNCLVHPLVAVKGVYAEKEIIKRI
jgi:NDP-sugar pyrophosphorylase family protein